MVEPLGDWGAGAVMLLEIPTRDEYADNIVAFWRPAAPLLPGQRAPLRLPSVMAAARPRPMT
jgi:glucan biosynthesis protein